MRGEDDFLLVKVVFPLKEVRLDDEDKETLVPLAVHLANKMGMVYQSLSVKGNHLEVRLPHCVSIEQDDS